MTKTMPQELEVWYLIPALRRELAKIFIQQYGLKQKKAAECLGITEAAISQYLKSKRGSEIKFSEKAMKEIKRAAKGVVEGKEDIMKEIYSLCVQLRKSKAMCNLHRLQDKRVPKNCDVCLKD
ncbi:MAG: transcriptional regulator [Candidatus Pacearchaeota archaeon]|nr:transcriptional regulator [Candidatus Pacearchaeota archaeon]MDE1848856.1 transcriptional regulator [Nanoarchaeota archaeon]